MSSDQVLENLLDWCIKHTNILTAEDESPKKFDFIKYVKGKIFIKVLEMLIKKGKKVDMDFKKSINSCFSKEGIIQFVFGWYCRNTNLLSSKEPRSGRNFIHYATFLGCMPIVDCLLKVTSIKKKIFSSSYTNPVEDLINSCDHSGSTPLLIGSDEGHYELASLLLEKGAKVNSQDENLWTPLHKASKNGYFDLACLLISFNANGNAQTKRYSTPLHLASKEGHLNLARLLIKNGAFVNAQNKSFWSPLNIASKCGHLDLAKLLLQNGAEANNHTIRGLTALHSASQQNNLELALLLLEYGAQVNFPMFDYSTALDFAVENGHLGMAKLL